MDHVKTVYDMLKKTYKDRLTGCVRKGDLSPLFGSLGVPLDSGTTAAVLAYARQEEASKMSPPYLLSDYLCYMYDGDESQLARELGANVQEVEQAIYDGCYIHGRALLRPVPLSDGTMADFVAEFARFGRGKCLRADFWPLYVVWSTNQGIGQLKRLPFLKALTEEMTARGYAELCSVRNGDRVGKGYRDISVKTI